MSLINFEVNVLLTCFQSCIINNVAIAGSISYTNTDTKLHVAVASLSTKRNYLS